MKAPKPANPKGAPAGTVWFGGPIEWFRISLGITAEHLVPEDVSRLMGCEADESQQKGNPVLRPDVTLMRIAQFGAWRLILKPEETGEWDCAEAMMLVLRRLPSAVGLWRRITKRYKVAFFVGLSMPSKNKGFELSPVVMKYLGDRGIAAGFDVYYDGEETAEPAAPPNRRPARQRATRTPRRGGGR
jgi:hypothetical protein